MRGNDVALTDSSLLSSLGFCNARTGNGWAHHCCILLFEVHSSPSFVNRRNFDARHLAVLDQSKHPLIQQCLTSSIHYDYVGNRDVAFSIRVLFGSRMAREREPCRCTNVRTVRQSTSVYYSRVVRR